MRTIHRLLAAVLIVSASARGVSAPADIVRLYEQGVAAQIEADHYLAIQTFKLVLEENPVYFEALAGLAESYFALGEYEEALSFVRTARGLDARNTYLPTLEGRILLGLGDLAAARVLFDAVLRTEPNNLDARFGLAEIEVASGNPRSGADRFIASLRADPGNVRALLSLVILFGGLGEEETAGQYVRRVLQSAPGDPLVRYMAARHYFRFGDIVEARYHAKLAIDMKPDYRDAIRLLGSIELRNGDYASALPVLEDLLKTDRDDYLLWYALGTAYRETGAVDDAVNSFAGALRLRTDDEISRIALESFLMQSYDLDDPLRVRYAADRFRAADAYLERNLSEQALEQYRRGLMLDPRSVFGRLGYANIYKRRGFLAKYLSELNVLQSLGATDTGIEDEIEIYRSILGESVHADWSIDQFTVERRKHTVFAFFMQDPSYLLHPDSGGVLLDFIRTYLMRFENLKAEMFHEPIDTFKSAFEGARTGGADYFIIFTFDERERDFAVGAVVYQGTTGRELTRYSVRLTGNNRIERAVHAIAGEFYRDLPVSARLVERRFDEGLIDLGALDGLTEGDELIIVKRGELFYDRDAMEFTFADSSILGTFTVTRTDDLIAEGSIVPESFFDMVNQDDLMVFPVISPETAAGAGAGRSDPQNGLYLDLLRIP